MPKSNTARIRLLTVGLVVVAGLLLSRLFYIQIVHGEKYRDYANQQYANDSRELYNRGSIYFSRKDGQLVSAAGLKSGYLLAIHPNRITDPDALYTTLSQYIELNEENFKGKANKADDPYEEITEKINEETATQIEPLELEGVSLYPDRWRFYPGEDLASHVLGFVGFAGDEYSGRYGVERYYDDILERSNEGLYSNFFAQVFSGVKTVLSDDSLRKEGDLVLTIEPQVQDFIEKELDDLHYNRQSDESGIIVMNPQTGEIIAMAAAPDFNPQVYFTENDISVFKNPLVENIYEMGSIVKPLTIAAALDAGVLQETDTYNDEGYVEIDGERIGNYDGQGRGVVSVQEILNQSLNTGAIYAMQQLGRGDFRDYMLDYGLGDKTLIDLPDEVSGQVSNLESRGEVEFATASFGQGIAISPINITRALASLANGGILVRPHVIKEFRYDGLPKREVYTEEQGKVLKQETSERISRMLVKVVDEALRDGTVALPQYTVAAKTGTAQIPGPEGGYYSDRFLHSFFGYFPAYDPKFLVFLYTVNPKTGRYSSETLTDPFMQTTKFLLNYYEIPPDR